MPARVGPLLRTAVRCGVGDGRQQQRRCRAPRAGGLATGSDVPVSRGESVEIGAASVSPT